MNYRYLLILIAGLSVAGGIAFSFHHKKSPGPIHDQVPASPKAESSMPEGHGAVVLSLDRQQLIGVKLGFVEKKTIYKTIRASGRLAFDPELYTAQNEYIEAIKQQIRVKDSPLTDVKHSADAMVRSAKLRLKVLGLSDRQISQIANRENPEASLLINKPGQQVWIYAEVYEMDLPLIQAGQSAEITAGFLGGLTLTGKVASVDRVINTQTRTAKARILVTDAKTLLRPESYVDVSIRAPLGEQTVVPFDAVLDTGKEAWVFLATGQGRFEPRRIQEKFKADDLVAVESGVQPGDKIVTSANFLIDSESRLKGVITEGDHPACPEGQHWDTSMTMCMPGRGD